VVLGLLGRDRDRLQQVAERCRATGAEVRLALVDVRDAALLARWLEDFDRASPIELLFANAGVYTGAPHPGELEHAEAALMLMQINVLGVLNTVLPALPLMRARGRGRIAIMSSIAGLAPLPDAPAYSASKAAVLRYGLALRDVLYDTGVRVNVICPGYITSPMSRRVKGWKPLEMSAEASVARIVRGLERDRPVIAFPWPLALVARLALLLPDKLRRASMRPFRFHVAPSGGD